MNKMWLVLAILVIGAVGVFILGSNRNNKNAPLSTVNEKGLGDKKISETTVTVTGEGYDPQSLIIKARTKVVWVNKSGVAVTVHSALHPTHLVYPPLNLGQFEDGSSVSLVFDKQGAYKYHNHLNPTQFGSITVE